MTQSTLVNLHPNEYSQECHYYLFVVKLDVCKHYQLLKWKISIFSLHFYWSL